jgi:hypothetical protein
MKPVTDPSLLSQLDAPASKEVTDPAVLSQLNGDATSPPAQPEQSEELPFLTMAHMKTLDNNEEKRLYLSKLYGQKNVQEKDGQILVNGKSIKEPGWFKGMVGDVVGNYPQLAGMAAGATEGAELGAAGGPLTALGGGVLGAGIGAFSGKAAQEGVKAFQGEEAKSPSQLGESLSKATVGGAEGEMGGKILNTAVGKAMTGKLPEWITGTTKEVAEKSKSLIDRGAKLPSSSIAPYFKKFQRIEDINRRISGPYASADATNRKVLGDLSKDVLKEAGIPESHLDAVYKDIASGAHAVDTKEAGEAAKKAITAHKEAIMGTLDKSVKAVEQNLDVQLSQLHKVASSYPAGSLGVDVSKGFMDARKAFSTAFSTAYRRIDKMLGGKPVVPVDDIVREAKRVIQVSKGIQTPQVAKQMSGLAANKPDQEVTELFKSLDIDLPAAKEGKLTLEQAQRMRTLLRERANKPGLTQGVTEKEASQLEGAINLAIRKAANDPAAKEAIPLLLDVDKRYALGIKKFNDSELKTITDRYKSTGIVPDPQQVVDHLIRSGESSRAEMIKSVLPQDVWKRVVSQDLKGMIDSATDKASMTVSPDKLLSTVASRGAMLDAVHGKGTASALRDYAKHLAVFEEKMPIEQVANKDFAQLAHEWQAAKAASDTYMKDNFLNELTNPKKPPEAVYDFLTEPGQTARLKEAIKVIGKDSEAARLLTTTATKKLVAGMLDGINESGYTVNGSISRELKKYTAEQQAILFPNELTDSMRKLADDAQMLFPDRSDEAMAGMTAGAKMQMPTLQRWWYQFMSGMGNYLVRHQAIQRYLFIGRDRGEHAMTDSARMNLVRFFGEQASQQDSQDDSQPQPGVQ